MVKCMTEGCDNEAIEGAEHCKECRNKMNEGKEKRFYKNLKKGVVAVGCVILAAVGVTLAKSRDSA